MESIIWLAPFVFLLAGTVKGALGIGLPTTVIAVLSQVTDPRVAIAVGLLPVITSNLWQVYREGGWREPFLRFWPYAATLGVSIFLFSGVAAEATPETVTLATGIAIAIFAAANLYRRPPPLPRRWERPAQIGFGLASGVMGGLTGLWSPPLLIMLLSMRLPKSEMVRSMGLLFLLGGAPMFAGYVVNRLITMEIFLWSLVMLIPTFLGFTLGERVRRKMADARFQKAVLVFFLLMGLNMIRRGLMG
ncbi:sulfite exporter TauE/SafE family protein [Pikeienuella piscinae]|uniref:Probable membrane transporter protein n=1 Tax=Pikeienuella piscinae TaxID=2748098 RepID=A0A7L5BZP2_9RHOB|nr:sulfite exporter TauE/SafE family protein [Pikeienuella piscinae]QIE56951.1 sulfite exporter TauE/SafE family protein [Pikeienuella piscinae]